MHRIKILLARKRLYVVPLKKTRSFILDYISAKAWDTRCPLLLSTSHRIKRVYRFAVRVSAIEIVIIRSDFKHTPSDG